MTINNFAVKHQVSALCGEAAFIIRENNLVTNAAASLRLSAIVTRLVALHRQMQKARVSAQFQQQAVTASAGTAGRYRLQQSAQSKDRALVDTKRVILAGLQGVLLALFELSKKSPLQDQKAPELYNALIDNLEEFTSDLQKVEQLLQKLLAARQVRTHASLHQIENAQIRQDLSNLRLQQQDSAGYLLALTILFLRLATFFKRH